MSTNGSGDDDFEARDQERLWHRTAANTRDISSLESRLFSFEIRIARLGEKVADVLDALKEMRELQRAMAGKLGVAIE